uniref:N-domain of Clp chaperone n=1 Tax=Eustigmatophyceae sp. Mont 10/10-1w TaxID=2506145 RepID=A0A451FMM1_9STRA|nr:N-domain of Clp chaperone [Eustigmatophyceae sp. Mont 10/10-1w]QAA11658.1 N-domain of Clp chaperone [Eustigmatophyceae sp. Mont 10/10-1w]
MNFKKLPLQKNYFFSKQYKKVLYYAFLEAKYNELPTVNLNCLLYGLLKSEFSLSKSILDKINYSKKSVLLKKIKLLIKEQKESKVIDNLNEPPILSKTVRQIIFNSICQSKSFIITTDDLLLALLSNLKSQKLIVDLIFEI